MYNIIEEDVIGTHREHLVHPDLVAGTMCGLMDTSGWPDVVQRELDVGNSFPFRRTLKCVECLQNEPLSSRPQHMWLRDGGRYKPFKRSSALRDLGYWNVDTNLPEYSRLTPGEYARIAEEVRNGTFRPLIPPESSPAVVPTAPAAGYGLADRIGGERLSDYGWYRPRLQGTRPAVWPQTCPICRIGRLVRSSTAAVDRCSGLSCAAIISDGWWSRYRAAEEYAQRRMVSEYTTAAASARAERAALRLTQAEMMSLMSGGIVNLPAQALPDPSAPPPTRRDIEAQEQVQLDERQQEVETGRRLREQSDQASRLLRDWRSRFI